MYLSRIIFVVICKNNKKLKQEQADDYFFEVELKLLIYHKFVCRWYRIRRFKEEGSGEVILR